ncbi:hypothetical protein [Rhodococcus sp. SGAir0479]|uniref:hypothetical protein n=1 Tax=Rhodococcus sp. SGAir0479 TaxID=2567884 RepID=UPI0020C7582E|nr:hypothetical protein [Rhodococcus sp. SGAir0479]
MHFVLGDVTRLPAYVDSGYVLAIDIGCFHGLGDDQRIAYGDGLGAVTQPGAQLLMFSFTPGRRRPLPRGASMTDVTRALRGWTAVGDDAMDTDGAPGLLARAHPHFLRLVRE